MKKGMVNKTLFSFLLLIIIFANSNCKINQLSSKDLYKLFMDKPLPVCMNNFEGMGRELFPDFMTWGCFKYEATFECIDNYYLKDTMVKEMDTKFEIADCSNFPKDLSFYKEAIESDFLSSKYDCTNKVYIYSIRYPYVHSILFDSSNNKIVHIVTTIRD